MDSTEEGRVGAAGASPDRRTATHRLNEAAAALAPLARRLTDHGEADAARVVEGWRQWADSPVVVAVVGEVKRGKSTLVNALVGQAVSPAGPDVVTRGEIAIGAPTADLPEGQARLLYDDGSLRVVPRGAAVQALTPDPGTAGAHPPRGGGAQRAPVPIMAQLAVTSRWLPGTALLDTPGVGGLVGEHGARARTAADRAGALLFVTDGGQVLTRPELDFLREVTLNAEFVVFALTKIDRTDGWRTVLEENRRLIAEHAPRFADSPTFPVAAALAEAAWTQDAETAALLEKASGIPELAAGLTTLTDNGRRVAVAKALRIAVTGFTAALSRLAEEEAAVASPAAVGDLEAEQDRLARLSQRRNYLRVYVERDLGRARADALALMNVLVDDATAAVTARAHTVKAAEVEEVTEELRRQLRAVVEEVRTRFVTGVGVAVEEAFKGLEPSPEPAWETTGQGDRRAASPGGQPAGTVTVTSPADGTTLALRTLADLLPAGASDRSLGGAVELGRVVTPRSAPKTSVLDPSMASHAFMGSHLGSMVGMGGPFGVLFAAGWVAVNLATRRTREGRQQLGMAVADSFSILRRDLPGVLDAITRELRPELIIEVERTLDERIREVQRVLGEAKTAHQAQERERRAIVSRLEARRTALTDLRAHAESLLTAVVEPSPS